MRFLVLYRPARDAEAGPPSPERLAAVSKFVEEEKKAGTLLQTGGLYPPSQAARVRLAGGKVTVTDGPFTEARELIGGFAIIQADSREAAVEMARRFLAVGGEAETEVRQIFDGANARKEEN